MDINGQLLQALHFPIVSKLEQIKLGSDDVI